MLMDFQNALTYYEKVLILYPNQYVSLSGKGDCLRMLGLYQQALEVYNQALFIQNRQPSLLQKIGVIGKLILQFYLTKNQLINNIWKRYKRQQTQLFVQFKLIIKTYIIIQNNFETASLLLKQAKKVAPPNFYVDKAIQFCQFKQQLLEICLTFIINENSNTIN